MACCLKPLRWKPTPSKLFGYHFYPWTTPTLQQLLLHLLFPLDPTAPWAACWEHIGRHTAAAAQSTGSNHRSTCRCRVPCAGYVLTAASCVWDVNSGVALEPSNITVWLGGETIPVAFLNISDCESRNELNDDSMNSMNRCCSCKNAAHWVEMPRSLHCWCGGSVLLPHGAVINRVWPPCPVYLCPQPGRHSRPMCPTASPPATMPCCRSHPTARLTPWSCPPATWPCRARRCSRRRGLWSE